jgi:carbon-monoxide dehydrogenase medium subunit
LANNDPAADYPAAALALNARIHTTSREIAADDFFEGMFTTALEEDEIITAISFTAPAKGGYGKFPNPASRYAMAGVFVAKSADGSVRVAVTGASEDGVYRHDGLEAALSADWSASAVDGVEISSDGLLSDLHGNAEYRANLIKVMAKRALGLIFHKPKTPTPVGVGVANLWGRYRAKLAAIHRCNHISARF